jgi:hypothetical protein
MNSLLVALVASAHLAAAPLVSPNKTFSVTPPPAGWTCQSSTVPQGRAELVKCRPTVPAGKNFFVMLKSYDSPPGQAPSLKTITSTAFMNNYRKLFSDVKVTTDKAGTFAGVPSHTIGIWATHSSMGVIRQLETIFSTKGKYFVITISGTDKEYQQHAKTAEPWLKSGFKLLTR